MRLTNPRALAGGKERDKHRWVLTQNGWSGVKTPLGLVSSIPPAKARGLVKRISFFLSVTKSGISLKIRRIRPHYSYAEKIRVSSLQSVFHYSHIGKKSIPRTLHQRRI